MFSPEVRGLPLPQGLPRSLARTLHRMPDNCEGANVTESHPQCSDPDFWDVWTLADNTRVYWAGIANEWAGSRRKRRRFPGYSRIGHINP